MGTGEGRPPQQVGRGRRTLVSLEAAPCPGESSSPEMILEGLAWGHESIELRVWFPLYKWRQARKGILWLSNTILVGPAHQAWPWEEQTSCLPCPNRFVDTGCQLPLTALRCGCGSQSWRSGDAGEDLYPSPASTPQSKARARHLMLPNH